ncbi:MAG TPA: ABC transporter permease subunit [Actinoplanes sp.]|nr:ABC transporter permease subunit [Actinoplanes sp.]
MIWLTWRQFRVQAWVTVAALVVLATTLAVTGPELRDLYRASGLATCTTDCGTVLDGFRNQVTASAAGPVFWATAGVMFLLPAVIGIFWGAPLVARELEAGTHRLVWTQSVPRTRWLAVKVAAIGTVAILTAAACGAAVTWWAQPIDDASQNRLLPEMFAIRGIVPIAYAAFAFVVGVLLGMVIRRTVPAMAATLIVVAVVQIALPFFVRPHLTTPVRVDAVLAAEQITGIGIEPDGAMQVASKLTAPGAWELSNETYTAAGTRFTGPADRTKCGPAASYRICREWLNSLGLRQQASYVPADRFWPLQWREAALMFGVTGLLTGFTVWWLRRRIT